MSAYLNSFNIPENSGCRSISHDCGLKEPCFGICDVEDGTLLAVNICEEKVDLHFLVESFIDMCQ